MDFIVSTHKQIEPHITVETFLLIPNSWNDHGFKTQYSLYYFDPASSHSRTFIGIVKILRQNQTNNQSHELTDDFQQLTNDYISMGQSLDYYQRLSELPIEIHNQTLTALNDAVFNPSLRQKFKNHPGWDESLLREIPQKNGFLSIATSILKNSYSNLIDDNLTFSFQYEDWENPITFDFSPSKENPHLSKHLPNRIMALVGPNGSGKSTLLSRIARIAYATQKDRESSELRALGEIVPSSIGFPRIITISYSPFDSFKIPLINYTNDKEKEISIKKGYVEDSYVEDGYYERSSERQQLIHDMQNGSGRFIFCGIRNIAEEASVLESQSLDAHESDRVFTTIPKPIELLKTEFIQNFKRIVDQGNEGILNSALQQFKYEKSFSHISHLLNAEDFKKLDLQKIFMDWSTGHKIVMQIVFSLVAHTTQSSLVLIDEPETHLHPPLLAALMHAIREVLNKTKAFAIIATHSPVVLQETLRKNTYVIQRYEQYTSIQKPNIETFGENIGTLTSTIFGLNSQETDFYKTLKAIADKEQDIKIIENLFSPEGLSNQARAYILNRISKLK